METGILGFLTSIPMVDWAGLVAVFVLLFDRIAKLTPTKKDDGAVSWLYKIVAVLGVKVPDIQTVTKAQPAA